MTVKSTPWMPHAPVISFFYLDPIHITAVDGIANTTIRLSERYTSNIVNSYWPAVFGFFLGFAFGVGCALAVMYSIYMGGYRAAIRDSLLPNPPSSYLKAVAKATPRT